MLRAAPFLVTSSAWRNRTLSCFCSIRYRTIAFCVVPFVWDTDAGKADVLADVLCQIGGAHHQNVQRYDQYLTTSLLTNRLTFPRSCCAKGLLDLGCHRLVEGT